MLAIWILCWQERKLPTKRLWEICFSSTPPKSSNWFEEMKKLEGGMESGSHITTRDIEFPLNAVVMQFQRLNIATVESCKGFHNKWQMRGPVRYRGPYVKFLTWRGALLADTILKSGGYNCELDKHKRLFIHEAIDGIFDLGLWLYKINCAYEYLKPLQKSANAAFWNFSLSQEEVDMKMMWLLT